MATEVPSGEADTLHAEQDASSAPARVVGTGTQLGRYLVLEHIGAGGMGTVYAAWDPRLDRKLALKLLSAPSASSEARLLREAQALARLDHPNVIKVHDVGTYASQPFVAMEFVDGETLRSWLERGGHDWKQLLEVFLAAGAGLAAAHAAGLIHRDFKPENVMLGADERVRVLDFGLARAPEAGELEQSEPPGHAHASGPRLTRGGELLGTPSYMSPEQIEARPLDARSDQFSFCVALWEALSGTHPFPATTRATRLAAICRGKLGSFDNPEVPRQIVRTLERGLSVDAAERWRDMPALLDALSARPAKRRQQRLSALAALGLAVLASATAIGRHSPADQPIDCSLDPERLEGVWDAPARARLEHGFASFEGPEAAHNAAEVQERLDEWVLAWSAMVRDSCEAHHLRHQQSAELFDLRMSCLDDALDDFSNLGQLLDEQPSDPLQVNEALARGELLAKLEHCTDASALRGASPPPSGARAEQYARLLSPIRRSGQLIQLGRYRDAVETLEPLAEAIEQLDHLPLTNSYFNVLALARRPLATEDGGEAALASLRAALAADEPYAEIYAALVLARNALQQGKLGESQRWLSYAEGSAVHSDNPLLHLEIGKAWTFVAISEQRYEDALSLSRANLERARVLAARRPTIALAEELSIHGKLLSQRSGGRPELAAAGLEAQLEANSIVRERMQPGHWSALGIRLNLTYAYIRTDELERAHNINEVTGQLIRDNYGTKILPYEAYLRHRATIAERRARCAEADALALEHFEWLRANNPSNRDLLATSLLTRARGCALSASEALPLLDEAVELSSTPEGPAGPVGVEAHLTRSAQLFVLGREQDAREDLQRARAAHDPERGDLELRLQATELLAAIYAQPRPTPSERARLLEQLEQLRPHLDPLREHGLVRIIDGL